MTDDEEDKIVVDGKLYEKYFLMPIRVENGVYVCDGPDIECLRLVPVRGGEGVSPKRPN